MDLSLLDTLKQNLLTATQFKEVANYFLTHFGENREFMALGDHADHAMIQMAVEQIVAQVYKDKNAIVLTKVKLIHLPEQRFLHGSFIVNGHIGTVIYFEDVYKGLVVIAPPSGDCHFCRFSGRPEYRPTRPSVN